MMMMMTIMMMMMTMVIIIVIIIISLSAGNSHSDHCDGAKAGDDDDHNFFYQSYQTCCPHETVTSLQIHSKKTKKSKPHEVPACHQVRTSYLLSPTFINKYIIILIPSSSETWRLKGLVLTTTPDSAAGRRAVKGQKACLSRQGEYH